jgi:mRNA interferase MazF
VETTRSSTAEDEEDAAEEQGMTQYEIWWIAMPEPVGRRPVLLLSRHSAYRVLTKFVVAEITTRVRGIPQEVRLGVREGLPTSCAANLDNIRTVHESSFIERAGRLSGRRVREVKRALGHALAWPELTLDE